MRVLVAGPAAGAHGGIGSVERELERAVADRVALTTVVTHRDGPAVHRARSMVAGTARGVRGLLRRPPDVLHVHLSQRASVLRKGVLLRVAAARGVPTVVHAHGSGFLDWFDAMPPRVARVVRALLRADRVVVLSDRVADAYRERLHLAPDALVVLPNPVRTPGTVAPHEDAEPVLAVHLGRLGERKGVYDLVRAVALLPAAERARLRVVAAGDGEVDEARAAVHDAGVDDVVDVRPWLDEADRDAVLARADLFVLPSSHEGLPMAVLEAMARHVVPVVTPVGGLPDLVHDGDNGVVVPVADPAALAGALGRLVDDDALRTRLADHARSDVAGYSSDVWSDRLVALWTGLARPAGS